MGLPLILGALGALQVGGQIAGAIQGNQQRQAQKGFVDRAYTLGRKRLDARQGDQRASQAEGLIARGLAGGGLRTSRTPIRFEGEGGREAGNVPPAIQQAYKRLTGRDYPVERTAVTAVEGAPAVSVAGARTLGEQQQMDLMREQQLEQNALRETRDSARAGVNAAYNQQLVGQVGNAIAGGIQGYQTGQIYNAYRGIDPVDPLGRGAWSNRAVDELNVFERSG